MVDLASAAAQGALADGGVTIHDIDPDALAAVARATKNVADAVEAELSPPGLSLYQANGPAAAQSVPHFHIHVLPRRSETRAAS